MKSRHHFLGNLPVILLACSLLAAPAQAQQTTSRVVFVGDDASGNRGLWVTDGTSAGTSELVVAGARASGLFAITFDPHFAAFGGKVLFEGYDATNRLNLWITNGTAAGTSEVTAAGAYSGGLFNTTAPISANFTVFGGKVVFEGTDAAHNRNLWVTDGTSAGTSELTVAGAFPSGGLFSGIEPDFNGSRQQGVVRRGGCQRARDALGDGWNLGRHQRA